MAVFNTPRLLLGLRKDVSGILQTTRASILPEPVSILQQPPAPGSWSVLQCLEHLNFYGSYYIPELGKALSKSSTPKPTFRSGWLGGYFTKLMQPKADGALRSKMKSPENARPSQQPDAKSVLTEFIAQQEQLLVLLDRAADIDLARPRIPVSISKWIRMSAGDTFRFLIAHEQRHLLQALRAIMFVKQETATAVSLRSLETGHR